MRKIAIISAVQIAVVVLGWCALGIVLKFNGYPDENHFVRWKPLAVWLREFGFWLMLITPVWMTISVVCERKEDRNVLNNGLTAVGVLVGLIIFAVFLVATFNPYTRPLLIGDLY